MHAAPVSRVETRERAAKTRSPGFAGVRLLSLPMIRRLGPRPERSPMNPFRLRLFLALPFVFAAATAAAEAPAVRENLLSFTTTASREVVQDRLAITLQ